MNNNLKNLGELIRAYFKNIGKEEEFLEAKIKNNWERFVGSLISEKTSLISLNKNLLYIKVSSNIAKEELLKTKEQLKLFLTNFLDYEIKDIIIF